MAKAKSPTRNKDRGALAAFRRSYLRAILDGSEDHAKIIVTQALSTDYSAADVAELILAHAQRVLGKLWHKGSITIAEEHRATQVTLQTLGYVSSATKAGSKVGKRMLVTSLQGDGHLIGVRIVADMFRLDGWDVDSLGTDLPADEIVEFVKKSGPFDIVGFSLTMPEAVSRACIVATKLNKLDKPPKIIAGGQAISTVRDARERLLESGVDVCVGTVQHAIKQARILVGLQSYQQSLEDVLKAIGARVQFLRKHKKLSQQNLSDQSGLDRAYLSGIEHGKQNLTIGAALKIAQAFEIRVEELLAGTSGE